jgi:hypothetical protein
VTACTCPTHQDGAPTALMGANGAHVYWCVEDRDRRGKPMWRWLCSCTGRGQWTYRDSNQPYHAWCVHVERSGRRGR